VLSDLRGFIPGCAAFLSTARSVSEGEDFLFTTLAHRLGFEGTTDNI